MENSFITVVFKCGDDALLRGDLHDAFEDNMRFRGAEIASISSDDVISHVEQIEKDLKQGSTK